MKPYYDPMKEGYVWFPKRPSLELQPVKAVHCPDERIYRRATYAERNIYDKQHRKTRR